MPPCTLLGYARELARGPSLDWQRDLLTQGLCPCESCEKRVPHDEIVAQEDVDLCRACYAEWKAIFDACTHAWRPAHNQMGEPAHICDHCSACIADESFPDLFGQPAPERPAEPVTF